MAVYQITAGEEHELRFPEQQKAEKGLTSLKNWNAYSVISIRQVLMIHTVIKTAALKDD